MTNTARNPLPITNRKNKLSLIHIAKKNSGIEDDAYRILLEGAAGVDSAAKIEYEYQFNAVMKAFENLGFKSTQRSGGKKEQVMGDPLLKQSLFDLQNSKGDIESKKPEFSEMPQIDEPDADWSGDFEQLEDLIGEEAAWKIAEVYAGSTIYIPKSILTNKNYFNIRKKYKNGSSYRELSIEFGYSEMHIRNIIHKNKTDKKG